MLYSACGILTSRNVVAACETGAVLVASTVALVAIGLALGLSVNHCVLGVVPSVVGNRHDNSKRAQRGEDGWSRGSAWCVKEREEMGERV